MRQFLYCVFDSCAGFYDRPFAGRDDASAIRSFGDIACDADHPIGKHPEHYMLFRVGLFDDGSGEIVPESPVCVGKAHELVVGSGVLDVGDKYALLSDDQRDAIGVETLKGDGHAS